jgi:hypothetical protein
MKSLHYVLVLMGVLFACAVSYADAIGSETVAIDSASSYWAQPWFYSVDGYALPAGVNAKCEDGSVYRGLFKSSYGNSSNANGWDSLNGATAICTLLTNYTPPPGYDIILRHSRMYAGGADSIRIAHWLIGCDENGNKIDSLAFDTTLTADSTRGTYLIPFGRRTFFFPKYQLLWKAYTGNKSKVGLGKTIMVKAKREQ